MNEKIIFASDEHEKYSASISNLIIEAAKTKGSGLAKRSVDYITKKIKEKKAVIALSGEKVVGFCYIESWGHDCYVANSGLIVSQHFRGRNLARKIKAKAFELSLKIYPKAKIFGLTTSLAVMKINSELGYRAVTFSELTDDKEFWEGCESCNNYDILQRTQREYCLCNAMLYNANVNRKPKKPLNIISRLVQLTQFIFKR